MQPCILKALSPEAENLEIAARLLTRFNTKGSEYHAGRPYFDFGQNWEWTTLIVKDMKTGHEWQALNPRDWREIVTAGSANELIEAIMRVVKAQNLI